MISIEQLKMFDMLEQIDDFDIRVLTNRGSITNNSITAATETKEEDYSEYLQKGEKILSLLRERKRKESRLTDKKFLMYLSKSMYHKKRSTSEKLDYLCECVANKMLKPALDDIVKEKDSPDRYGKLHDLFGILKNSISISDATNYGSNLMSAFFRKKKSLYSGTMQITLKSNNEVTKMLSPMGSKARLSSKQSGRTWSLIGQGDYILCVDTINAFSPLILHLILRQCIQEELNGLSMEELKDNKIYCHLVNRVSLKIRKHLDNGILYINEEAYKTDYIMQYLKDNEFSVKKVSDAEEKELKIKTLSKTNFLPLFYLTQDLKEDDWDIKSTYSYMGKKTYKYDYSGGISDVLIVELFDLLLDIYQEDMKAEEFMKALASDYAKSYQTKKNIPLKCQQAMVKSKFNEYFGYIEFDEECDLVKTEELYKELRAIADLLSWSRKEEVSLRFRKLGNHKAAGLYYPTMKCLCIDARYPSSMAHEYFHMLDYEAGEASRGYRFYELLLLYRKCIEDFVSSLPEGDALKERLNGHTKYNKEYYNTATEAFARCGEIYLVRILGIDNSLVKPDGGFAYPTNPELNKAIELYFDEFFDFKEPVRKISCSF